MKTKIIKNQSSIRKYNINRTTEVAKMALAVKTHIIKHNLYAEIVGKNYVMVEGWQFAGGLLGLMPKIKRVESIGDNKWLAEAEIINQKTKEVVSTGFAICSKAEAKKKSFDEYAILSMAQTRAIGKAYRNYIGWIIKMAGYEGTPAEEIKQTKTAKSQDDIKADEFMASDSEKERIKKTAKEMGINTIKGIENLTEIKIDWTNLTKNQANRIYAELLNKQIKK